MKRVIAVSDSHGDVPALRDALMQARSAGTIDAVVFLGDGMRDFEAVRPMVAAERIDCYAVRGNNDWSSSAEAELVFTVGGVRFYACHGHMWRVKFGLDRLWYAAKEREAEVALYGHTHRASAEVMYGMHMINPGSVGERRRDSFAYAEIIIHDNRGIQMQLVKWS